MKKIKYILILILSVSFMTSCFDDTTELDLNDDGLNVVTWDRVSDNLTGVAEEGGAEYTFMKKIKLVGPTKDKITSTITVDATVGEGTTADGTMYTINNLPLTLSPENNFLAEVSITLTTLGNEPPKENTPEYDAYVAPVLYLDLVATGDAMVTGSGKTGKFVLNFTPRNPYAGEYTAHVIYRHPSVGTYPDNINVEEDNIKTLTGVTARKCEVGWFAVWEGYLSWITVNADYSVKYEVSSDWGQTVKMGDGFNTSLISHFDPADGKIYLYYHYDHTSGTGIRSFWEYFTPNFDYTPPANVE